jgi:transcriptional regulator with PAS, ATPase and Fis domain
MAADDREAARGPRGFSLTIASGPRTGEVWRTRSGTCAIGSDAANDVVLEGAGVGRFHCGLRVEEDHAMVVDLKGGSPTIVDGVSVREASLRHGSVLRLGDNALVVHFDHEPDRLPISDRERFGSLVGRSVAMRAVFAQLERAAATSTTVLLEGETGTGKSAAAAAIHAEGPRRDGPFIAIDCSAIPANLLESELFGHERGAFTGAVSRHIGAFEAAHGGTLFLDEIGELPPDLQPKLLRALESREIRRVGAARSVPVDVRIIAATNRDLRAAVEARRFRADVYFRIAVVSITLPSLRQRPEDLPALVEEILGTLKASEEERRAILGPASLAQLRRAAWPGNIRELRNHLERTLFLSGERTAWQADEVGAADGEAGFPIAADLPYGEARKLALAEFDRRYFAAVAARVGGQLVAVAAAARIHRVHLYKLLRRAHGPKTLP